MQIFSKPVALHYEINGLPLTKPVKGMTHMIMSQEVTIAVPEVIVMQTIEGVADIQHQLDGNGNNTPPDGGGDSSDHDGQGPP
jgi:hypothetical protein